ncbi:MAG: Asp23/Gls24 family envelope stress response protein [Oscillospiraceae bacterium]|nr:Asp23/Gls24 family envelope stress response protein [Oscillospiraceae bacterium]
MADSYISRKMDKGTINISEDVVASLVRSAVTETDGVAELASTVGYEDAESGTRKAIKGVKVRFKDEEICADAVITVKYGGSILDVAKKVQENALSAIQTSTGFEDASVNVHVAGVAF